MSSGILASGAVDVVVRGGSGVVRPYGPLDGENREQWWAVTECMECLDLVCKFWGSLLSLVGSISMVFGEGESKGQVATIGTNLLSFWYSCSSRCIAWSGGGCKRAIAWTTIWWLHGYGDGAVDRLDRAGTPTYIRHNDVDVPGPLDVVYAFNTAAPPNAIYYRDMFEHCCLACAVPYRLCSLVAMREQLCQVVSSYLDPRLDSEQKLRMIRFRPPRFFRSRQQASAEIVRL